MHFEQSNFAVFRFEEEPQIKVFEEKFGFVGRC